MYTTFSVFEKRGVGRCTKLGLVIILAVLILQGASLLQAQDFPSKQITFIVPWAAGSGTDILARAFTSYAEKKIGATILIDNVPGGDARIGVTKIFKAKPDGYTLGFTTFPTPIIHEYLLNVAYKSDAFSFIYAFAIAPQLIFVNGEKWKSFEEFIDEARKRPLTVGMSGSAGVPTLMMLSMEKQLKVKFVHVPYPGAGETLAAVAGKHVDAGITATAPALGMVKSGMLRPLVIWSIYPDVNYPEVPLCTKFGFPNIDLLRGVFGPPGLPADRVKILENAFSQAAAEPKFRSWAVEQGTVLVSMNAQEYREEIGKQQELVREFKDLLVPNKER